MAIQSTPKYDIFISFKNTDANGNLTKDSEIAGKLYAFLKDRGLEVFFSKEELEHLGKAQYSKVIDQALDSSSFLVVVGCNKEHFESEWVRYEWDSFLNEIRSNIKPNGEVFVFYQGMRTNDLPRALRQQQAFNADDESSYQRLFNYISNNRMCGSVQCGTTSELKPEIKNACIVADANSTTIPLNDAISSLETHYNILENYLEYSQVKHIEALEVDGKMEIHHAEDQQSFTAIISDVNKEKCLRQGFFMALIDFVPCENWDEYAKNSYTLEFEINGTGLNAVQLEVKNSTHSKIIDKKILITAEKQKIKCKLRSDAKIWEDIKEMCFVVFATEEYMQDISAGGQFTVENIYIRGKT